MLYPVAIEKGDDQHAYSVVVPDIAGCFSAGDTLEEALEQVKEAIAGHLQLLVDDNEDIPLASNIENHVNNPDYTGFYWFLLEVDASRYMGKTEKVNVTLPSRIVHMIDARVQQDNRYRSRSAFLSAGAEALLQRTSV